MPSRARATDQRGFTLIEVLVAIFILLVGVLGVVTLVDGANAVTSKTKAREGGTNVARSVIEVARSIRYRDLTADALLAALDSRPGLEDAKPATPGYTIRNRKVDYQLTLTVCSLDDPKDNLGTQPSGVTFCADSDVLGLGETSRDRNPDDYKRVRVTLVWNTRNTTQSITQTSSIINPVGGLGPSVTGLTMTSPGSSSDPLRIDSEVGSASFAATTSTTAAEMNWSVSGDSQGDADGGPVNWTFQWNFFNSSGDLQYYDCTYVVQADAFDSQGRAGAPYARTVILNRRKPFAPEDFAGGRNGNGERVDLQWTPSPECDVVGYRVYRSDDPGPLGTEVTCLGQVGTYVEDESCIDETAPAGDLWYRVVAIDTLADGSLRTGDQSGQVHVTGSNDLPSVPANVSSCTGGDVGCLDAEGNPATSGAIVLRWDPSSDPDGSVEFYRIYRDGVAYGNRWDVFFPNPGIAWFEPEPDGVAHSYRVSAVDNDFGESALSEPVDAG
jgi:prepilin-type N-terminal cleavage/methylation domain-containing protein